MVKNKNVAYGLCAILLVIFCITLDFAAGIFFGVGFHIFSIIPAFFECIFRIFISPVLHALSVISGFFLCVFRTFISIGFQAHSVLSYLSIPLFAVFSGYLFFVKKKIE